MYLRRKRTSTAGASAKKYGPSKTPWQLEPGLKHLEPPAASRRVYWGEYAKHLGEGGSGIGQDLSKAIMYKLSETEAADADVYADRRFEQDFVNWLQNDSNGRFNDHNPFKGRVMPMRTLYSQHHEGLMQLKDIRDYVKQQHKQDARIYAELERLKRFGPLNLQEAYLYFKYVVRNNQIDPLDFIKPDSPNNDDYWHHDELKQKAVRDGRPPEVIKNIQQSIKNNAASRIQRTFKKRQQQQQQQQTSQAQSQSSVSSLPIKTSVTPPQQSEDTSATPPQQSEDDSNTLPGFDAPQSPERPTEFYPAEEYETPEQPKRPSFPQSPFTRPAENETPEQQQVRQRLDEQFQKAVEEMEPPTNAFRAIDYWKQQSHMVELQNTLLQAYEQNVAEETQDSASELVSDKSVQSFWHSALIREFRANENSDSEFKDQPEEEFKARLRDVETWKDLNIDRDIWRHFGEEYAEAGLNNLLKTYKDKAQNKLTKADILALLHPSIASEVIKDMQDQNVIDVGEFQKAYFKKVLINASSILSQQRPESIPESVRRFKVAPMKASADELQKRYFDLLRLMDNNAQSYANISSWHQTPQRKRPQTRSQTGARTRNVRKV